MAQWYAFSQLLVWLPSLTSRRFPSQRHYLQRYWAVVILKEKLGWRRVARDYGRFHGNIDRIAAWIRRNQHRLHLGIGCDDILGCLRDHYQNAQPHRIFRYDHHLYVFGDGAISFNPCPFRLVLAKSDRFRLAGISGFFGWVWSNGCRTSLGRHAETHVVMPFDFVRLIWVSITGYLFFAEVPDIFVWLGGALIFSSTAYITIREHKIKSQAAKAQAD